MKLKISMIVVLLIKVCLDLVIVLFLKDTSNIEQWMILMSVNGLLMFLFTMLALFYSYSLGTPKKIVIYSFVIPFAYFAFQSLIMAPLFAYFLGSEFYWLLNLFIFVGVGIRILMYYFNFKFSKSIVFLVLVIFSMISTIVSFDNSTWIFGSMISNTIFIQFPRSFLLMIAILFDAKLRKNIFNIESDKIEGDRYED